MTSEVAPAEHGSGDAGEHELRVRVLEVFAKQVAKKGRQRDEPARGAGLGLIDIAELASDLLERADDARLSLEQVQAISLEASELNGSNGQSGTITAGFVPSGAQASTSTGAALPADLKKQLARYASVRGRKPRNAIASGPAAEVLAALDESTGDEGALWRPMGVATNAATVPFGSAAGDADVVILGSNDLWLWQSPLLQFRSGEKQGPDIVEAVLWAYVAVRLVRPRGLSAIRWT